EGEAVRVGGCAPPDRRGDPDLRRLRLHEGVPGRALLPRREDHRDLRGDERDPAARDRPLPARAAPAGARAGLMARKRDEPVRLTRIYTRGGDKGETSLGDGTRVPKTDQHVVAYGAVDELNSAIGLVLSGGVDEELRGPLERIQNDLFDLGADLSVPFAEDDGKLRVVQVQVEELER